MPLFHRRRENREPDNAQPYAASATLIVTHRAESALNRESCCRCDARPAALPPLRRWRCPRPTQALRRLRAATTPAMSSDTQEEARTRIDRGTLRHEPLAGVFTIWRAATISSDEAESQCLHVLLPRHARRRRHASSSPNEKICLAPFTARHRAAGQARRKMAA